MYNMLFNREDLLLYFFLLSLLSSSLSFILKPIWMLIGRPQETELLIREEMRSLKEQQQKLSMINDFVAYTKIQRKLNKLEDEMKELKQSRVTSTIKTKSLTTWCLHTLIALVLLVSTITHRDVPLVIFNQNLFPFESFLGYSCSVPHSIAPHSWIIITKVSTATVFKAISQFM